MKAEAVARNRLYETGSLPLLSRQLFDAKLPGLNDTVPPRALAISLLALSVAAASGYVVPGRGPETESLVWLLALVPPFLLAYYKGWGGAAIALAVGMALYIAIEVVLVWHAGLQIGWAHVAVTTTTMIGISLGAGALSESLLRQRAQALYLAYADPLTGLPNRRVLGFSMHKFFAAAQRGRGLSVALLDVDDFRSYNEQFGRQAGDEALRVIAGILDRNTRLMNVSGRFGGDEFLAIIPGESAKGATLFAERVRDAVGSTRMPHGGTCTLSVGVAEFSEKIRRHRDLIEAADQALAAAKLSGGNCISASPSEDRGAVPAFIDGDRRTGRAEAVALLSP